MIEIEILKMQHQVLVALYLIAAFIVIPVSKPYAYTLCGVAIFFAIKGFLV